MKTQLLFVSLVFTSCLMSCSDDSHESLLTQEFENIQKQYSEGPSVGPKSEFAAPDWYVEKVSQSMEAEIDKAMYARSNGRTAAASDYDMGYIIAPGTPCFGGVVTFFFNNEDSNPQTTGTALSGDLNYPWEIIYDGNLEMKFCRVSGAGYENRRYHEAHAILKLGALNIPSSETIIRYFDNQDGAHSSSTGNIFPNGVDSSNGNIALFFHNFGKLNGPASAGPSRMGILAAPDDSFGTAFHYFIDNEDSKNANYWRVNGGGKQKELDLPYMSGGLNSSFHILMFR